MRRPRSRNPLPGSPGRLGGPLALLALASCAAPLQGSLAPDARPDRLLRARGPLPSRIEHPLGLTLLSMRPRTARTVAPGSGAVAVELTHTTIHEVGSEGGDGAVFDGELTHGSVRLIGGLDERTDVEVELGLLYTTSGFLDQFIDDWHEMLGLPDGGRSRRDEDQFDMRLVNDNVLLWELEEDALEVMDLPVIVTRRLRDEDEHGPAIAARLGLELPLGDEDRGFGNGQLDLGTGVLLERSLGRWTITAGIDWVWTGDPDRFEENGVALRDLLHLRRAPRGRLPTPRHPRPLAADPARVGLASRARRAGPGGDRPRDAGPRPRRGLGRTSRRHVALRLPRGAGGGQRAGLHAPARRDLGLLSR